MNVEDVLILKQRRFTHSMSEKTQFPGFVFPQVVQKH